MVICIICTTVTTGYRVLHLQKLVQAGHPQDLDWRSGADPLLTQCWQCRHTHTCQLQQVPQGQFQIILGSFRDFLLQFQCFWLVPWTNLYFTGLSPKHRLQDAGNVDLALALSFLKLWGGEVFEMVKRSCETSRGDEVSVARQAWRALPHVPASCRASSQGWKWGYLEKKGSLIISTILQINSTICRCFGVMMNTIRWKGMMADERGALYFHQHR